MTFFIKIKGKGLEKKMGLFFFDNSSATNGFNI